MTNNGAFPASKAMNIHQSDTSRLTLHQRAPVKVLTDGKGAEGVFNDFPVGADHRDHHCHPVAVATPAIPCPICDSPELETEGRTHDTRFVRCEDCGFELHHCGPDARALTMKAALKAVHARQAREAENAALIDAVTRLTSEKVTAEDRERARIVVLIQSYPLGADGPADAIERERLVLKNIIVQIQREAA